MWIYVGERAHVYTCTRHIYSQTHAHTHTHTHTERYLEAHFSKDTMNLAEDYVQFCCQWVLDHNLSDVRIIDAWRTRQQQQKAKSQKGAKEQVKARAADESTEERLKNVCSKKFARVSGQFSNLKR